jgi:hypothetical protein
MMIESTNHRRKVTAWSRGGAFLLLIVLTACSSIPLPQPKVEPFRPSNFSASRTHLAPELVHVAVLPLESSSSLAHGQDATLNLLEKVLISEILKTRSFAVKPVDGRMLMSLVNRRSVSVNEPLPPTLFEAVAGQLDCQAVLFSEITALRAMAPLKMGWHLKLVDTQRLETIWEIDEFFDAGNIHVASAAEEYYQTQLSAGFRKPDAELVLASPRLYGQYALHAILSTLPTRK